ncbi:Retrovirus-related Pol polyprotein from transposon gypsy [Nosema granulosis]|uniref:Retrovirus-related Pol polyprotein from transposon gypsy n=1 Tax=Nosema granulosis TaxID=83296 RepID=A0A9P6GZC4_9MICR|nr:Retrovirus-related Pol polyprotein from transposon gypsy [Nosema granulosis]
MPIVYASRTLGETEKNYSISEKEMLAAIWGMEKFEYFLKGREFTLVTDHIALKAINEKGELKSARISRWIERIQQFNFEVEYKPGESIPHHVDGLSRLAKDATCNKIDTRISTEIHNDVMKIHEQLVHRDAKSTCQEYNRLNHNKITESECKKILKNCVNCKLYNPVRVGRSRDIKAYSMGEKVTFDIIGPIEGKYIIAAIDYFTRYGFARVLKNRESQGVLKFLKEIHKIIPVKTLISDSAKESISRRLKTGVMLMILRDI